MRPSPMRAHPIALVCVAAPEDAAHLEHWQRLLQPLEQAQFISVWSEQHIPAGANRRQELERVIEQADLAVLLLSADFFADPACLTMMELALHSSATVIPLLLRPSSWQESPVGTLSPWPRTGKAITSWNNQEEGWYACVQELRRFLGRQVSETLSSEQALKQPDPDWGRMLRRLHRSYKELLDQSLHGIAWVELGLAARPDLVSNIANLLFRRLCCKKEANLVR